MSEWLAGLAVSFLCNDSAHLGQSTGAQSGHCANRKKNEQKTRTREKRNTSLGEREEESVCKENISGQK